VTIGICAHNEAANIGRLLQAIRSQHLKKIKIRSVIVVSSGSTDDTESIVRGFPSVALIREKERRGKVSAINLILKRAKTPVVVLISADVIPEKDAIEKLCTPLSQPGIGICGAHPIPTNPETTLMGFVSHVVWGLHHQIALMQPKFGECIAFRRVFSKLPPSAVDEEEIASVIIGKGFKPLYVPDAIVFNKGPETARDFIKQRRRIYAGHLALRKQTGHTPPTMSNLRLLSLIIRQINLRAPFWTAYAMGLEGMSRILGYWDYRTGRKHLIWQTAASTKQLKP